MSSSPITDANRVEAAQHLYRLEVAAIERGKRELAHDVEIFTKAPTLSYLCSIETTVANLRRRLTRAEALEEVLP